MPVTDFRLLSSIPLTQARAKGVTIFDGEIVIMDGAPKMTQTHQSYSMTYTRS